MTAKQLKSVVERSEEWPMLLEIKRVTTYNSARISVVHVDKGLGVEALC